MIFILINILLLEIIVVSSWWSQSQIRSLMNGKCLNIAGGINSQGINIEMYDCDDNNIFSQSWFYDILTKEIKNMNPVGIEYCLDLPFGITDDGNTIRIYECNGSNAQKWLLNDDNTISNINGGCLDIKNGNNNNGAIVNLWTCDSNNINQKWILVSEIKSIMHGKCLDVDGGKTEPETNVQMYECNGKNAQKWYYNKLTKEIKNINPNGDDLCLDLDGGNNAQGTNIRIFTCNNLDAQKWLLNADESITNINGGCVDIFKFNQDNYANVNLWTCLGDNNNQKWFGSFIPMKSPQELIIRETSSYEWIWNDLDSGATLWGAYWKPKLYSTEVFLSFVNKLGLYTEQPQESSMVIMRYPSDAFTNPIGYNLIWDDTGSKGKYSVWVYRPIAPPGYICYGDFVQAHNSNKPTSADGYKCIHSRYVHFDNEELATAQELWWNDIKSDANDDIQIVRITTNHHYPTIYYRSHDQHLRYIGATWGALELEPIDETEYIEIKSVMNGKCLDIKNGNNADGTNVQMFDCNNVANAQKWKYNPSTQEFQTINGKCLDLKDGNNAHGTNIQILTCNGKNRQKWLINPDHTISNIEGGCLDILDYNGANNANIILYGCHGKKNQLWIGGDIFGVQDINKFAVERFAPILKFDQYGDDYGLPMNPQIYIDNKCKDNVCDWDSQLLKNHDCDCGDPKKIINECKKLWLDKCENKNLDITSNPTYYRILSGHNTNNEDIIDGHFDIVYWWYYGYQHRCNPTIVGDSGAHKGDWERIQVHINNWDIVSVTFFQHSGHYTAPVSYLEKDNDHTYVYVGKLSHGSYYDDRNDVGDGCGYFFDWRNPNHKSSLNTWNNLINLETSTDKWITDKIDICCSNPHTSKSIISGCDDTGCKWKKCDSDNELRRYPTVCAGL